MIGLVVLSLFCFMALLSYSPQDPGLDVAAGSDPVRNAGGLVGAWIASCLRFFLGQAAYLLPALAALKALDLFVGRHEPFQWNPLLLLSRCIGFGLLLLATAVLAHIQFSVPGGEAPGGVVGSVLGAWSEGVLNVQGSTLLYIGVFLFGLTVFTDLSWFRVMDLTGKITLDLCELLYSAGSRWWAAQQANRQLRKKLLESEAPQPVAPPAGRRATADAPSVGRPLAPEAPARVAPSPAPRAVPAEPPRVRPAAAPALDERIEPVFGLSALDEEDDELSVDDQPPVLRPIAERPAAPLAVAPEVDGVPFGSALDRFVEAPAVEHRQEPPRVEMPRVAPSPRSEPPVERPRMPEVRRPVEPPRPALHYVDDAVAGTLPPLSLLDPAQAKPNSFSPEALESMSRLLEIKLKEFGVEVQVVDAFPGPVITRFEIQPAPGIKVSRITNLAKDLARSLAVISVRVVEVIPGKTTVGIEIPNENRQIVRFSEVLSTSEYEEARSPVTIALGHDIGGRPVTADLAKMPHLLVAGTTGSGKSVGVNAMLLSILYKSTPEQVRLIMIDPKMLELSIYEGIPHLLCPVVTDMKEAANALRWSVAEMDRRYRLMAAMGVRNLAGFNRKIKDAEEAGTPLSDPLFRRESPDDQPPLLQQLPTIVVVVDEFADMMMIVGKKVEELIARIAQKARAAGIHLILATQRPSVDVITGLIKANIPTRIAFQVSSKIDSRTILDQGGAEQLLGHGDMLYMPPGTSLPVRVHGAFVSDDEVHRTVDAWKQRGAPDYIEDILAGTEEGSGGSYDSTGGEGGEGSEEDPLYDEAVRFVTESRRASISAVQRKLKIGYNRAARMIEAMEMAGVVTPMNTNGSREVIAPTPVRD